MIPLEEAQQFVLERFVPLPYRSTALAEAQGCVVGVDVVATEPVPPFSNSQMDGYALRAEDTVGAPVALDVIGTVMAGDLFDGVVGARQAVRIMTGAPMVPGADAVCMIELTEADVDRNRVTITREVAPGTFVRPPGHDVSPGDLIAPSGTVLTPAYLGVLANQGFESVTVHPRPRVGILSTGDELFSGPGPLPPGKIRDANRQTLMGLVRREGWDVLDLGIAGDDEGTLVRTLAEAAPRCDAIVSSGGVSMGDLDLVRVVLEKLSGGSMRWMQVAIRPAKPLAFGVLADTATPVFGLPGNPVSAMVSFELFVRPALRLLGGHRYPHRPVVRAAAAHDLLREPDGKLHLLRAELFVGADASWQVSTSRSQGSHQLHAMAEANALVLLADGSGARAGDRVPVLLIDPDRIGTLSEHGGPTSVLEWRSR